VAIRTIVYIDGFNLYYGAIKGTSHKWLNLQRYFEMLRPADDLRAIKYFTALVSGPSRSRQDTYLRALATLPLVEVILGRFKTRRYKCRHPMCSYTGDRLFDGVEEKRTDVNIAVSMVVDAYEDRCDQFVLVSGDSDLVPAMSLIRARFPAKKLFVYVPHIPSLMSARGFAVELRTSAHVNRDLPLNILPRAQFPARVSDGIGGFIEKPAVW
jgi:6-hydroxy-3-succinoylpyridine 3-monooxygenase